MDTRLYSYAFYGILATFPYVLYTSSVIWYILSVIAAYFILVKIKRRNITHINPRGHGVVISGCDTGIGHDLAKQLHRSGFTVFAGCLKSEGDGAEKLKGCGDDRMFVVPLDIRREDSVQNALKIVLENLPEHGLRGMVSNAGWMVMGECELLTIDLIQKCFDVNFLGAVRFIQTFLPLVRKSKGTVVINSSVRGLYNMPGSPAYNTTKHALESFADTLRLEMRKFGVKVALVEPGRYGTATAIVSPEQVRRLESEMEEMWSHATDEVKETYGRHYFELPLVPLRQGLTGACSDTILVTDALEDALRSSRPYRRNVVGGGDTLYDSDAMMARFNGILPSALADRYLFWTTGCGKFPSKDSESKLF